MKSILFLYIQKYAVEFFNNMRMVLKEKEIFRISNYKILQIKMLKFHELKYTIS